MATMKTLNGYGFNATELNGKTSDSYLQKTDTASDASKLGGKAPEYYIQPRNLLDNSDFRNPVNQRGATSYSGMWVYSIDRWIAWLDESNSATVSVINGGITPYPGMVIQRIKSKYIDSSKTYTLAAMTGDGLLVLSGKITSTSQSSTNANNGIYFNYNADLDIYQFKLAGLTSASKFVWAALYEGSYTADTLPPYVPKGYAAELAECRRYYSDLGRRDALVSAAWGTYSGTVTLPTVMATASPTVIVKDMNGNVDKASVVIGSGEGTSIAIAYSRTNKSVDVYPAGTGVAGQTIRYTLALSSDL